MRPSLWRVPLAVTASASILGTPLLPCSAVADENVDGAPAIVEISPRAVATTDFITDDDAVTLTAAGFLPGEEVRLDIVSTPRGIQAIHDRKRARADGTVTFPIGGSLGRPTNSFAGSYQAEIASAQSMEDGHLSDSFSILPVIPVSGADTSAGTSGATSPTGSFDSRRTNGIRLPSGPGFSAVGVGLSMLALVFTTAATAVMAGKSQRSTTDDRR